MNVNDPHPAMNAHVPFDSADRDVIAIYLKSSAEELGTFLNKNRGSIPVHASDAIAGRMGRLLDLSKSMSGIKFQLWTKLTETGSDED